VILVQQVQHSLGLWQAQVLGPLVGVAALSWTRGC
jgi:hypothetical protein